MSSLFPVSTFLKKLFLFFCVLPACKGTPCMSGTLRGHTRALDALELQSSADGSRHAGPGSRTWVLSKAVGACNCPASSHVPPIHYLQLMLCSFLQSARNGLDSREQPPKSTPETEATYSLCAAWFCGP